MDMAQSCGIKSLLPVITNPFCAPQEREPWIGDFWS
jgi:hypothetical protein